MVVRVSNAVRYKNHLKHFSLNFFKTFVGLLSLLLCSYWLSFCQAEELRKSLCAKDVPAKVYVGMRYWHPFTEEAIEQVPDQ